MFDYTELDKLEDMCREAGWDIVVSPCWEGQQIVLYQGLERVNDAIIHGSSYGHQTGLLETWENRQSDDVVGYLTAEQVFAIWKEDMAK